MSRAPSNVGQSNAVEITTAQAEAFADQITAIADGEGDPNDKRVRIDARKWIAARLLPKKYGDRVLHDTTEAASEALSQLELARRLAFVLQGITKPEAEAKLIDLKPEGRDELGQ